MQLSIPYIEINDKLSSQCRYAVNFWLRSCTLQSDRVTAIIEKTVRGDDMGDFIIKREEEKISSINRTIRFKPELFERVTAESERTGVSFNKIINQCVEYAFKNLVSTYEK